MVSVFVDENINLPTLSKIIKILFYSCNEMGIWIYDSKNVFLQKKNKIMKYFISIITMCCIMYCNEMLAQSNTTINIINGNVVNSNLEVTNSNNSNNINAEMRVNNRNTTISSVTSDASFSTPKQRSSEGLENAIMRYSYKITASRAQVYDINGNPVNYYFFRGDVIKGCGTSNKQVATYFHMNGKRTMGFINVSDLRPLR